MALKIIFAGTPEFAATSLKSLIEDNTHEICCVYTQPDRPAGRGRKIIASPVKQLALGSNIPVRQPVTLKSSEAQQDLQSLNADLMIVAAYGLILPPEVLAIPRLGCINIHASLLPRWRGAAPIQHAILADDPETGITIMQMDVGLDTGDILLRRSCPILQNDTSARLHDRLATLGAQLIIAAITELEAGEIHPVAQDDTLSTYAGKIKKSDALIDWQQSSAQIERKIRAYNPYPIAFSQFKNQTIRIWQAELTTQTDQVPAGTILSFEHQGLDVACSDDVLRITQLQLPGKKVLHMNDLYNAKKDFFCPGDRFE